MKLSTLLCHLMASIAISSANGGSIIECGWQIDNLQCTTNKCCEIYGTCGTGTNCELALLCLILLERASFSN
jgi:hypothetical protein